VGGSVYAGMIRKEAKTFVTQYADVLQSKKLGLFIGGMVAGNEEACLKANFPSAVLQAAKAASFLGGVYDPKKAGFMERIIIKAISKKSEYIDIIDDEKIIRFAEKMMS
jgi:menaquinone-dependent protoporphyrinogen oxidase